MKLVQQNIGILIVTITDLQGNFVVSIEQDISQASTFQLTQFDVGKNDTKRGRPSSAEIFSQMQERRNSAELQCAAPRDLRARRHVVRLS